ncbi:hypothetical protein [Dictyobacter halimunensis]|uniref:hypothetical protein n=1 Tax=Dictyobacter halimunensis TaxID=3026934 RepID=UPI003B97FFFF
MTETGFRVIGLLSYSFYEQLLYKQCCCSIYFVRSLQGSRSTGCKESSLFSAYDSGSSRWLYTAGGFSSGSVATYSFTYQQNGLQYDTSSYSWTHP